MKFAGFILMLFFTFSVMNAQKINSIYVKLEENKFKNKYRNFKTGDSIVLYQDSTFRREENYWGFDEIDLKIFVGKWNLNKNNLTLLVEKRNDSARVKIQPFVVSLKRKYLKKNYKKIQ